MSDRTPKTELSTNIIPRLSPLQILHEDSFVVLLFAKQNKQLLMPRQNFVSFHYYYHFHLYGATVAAIFVYVIVLNNGHVI